MENYGPFQFSEEEKQKIKHFKEWSISIANARAERFSNVLSEEWNIFHQRLYPQKRVAMDRIILGLTIKYFFEDILRFETYHDVQYADRHKYAAYLFKWLSRMCPIRPVIDHCEDLKQELTPEVLRANALFSLACAQAFLECLDFSADEKRNIIYSSMHRDIHAPEWGMIFYLLEKIHPKESSCQSDNIVN